MKNLNAVFASNPSAEVVYEVNGMPFIDKVSAENFRRGSKHELIEHKRPALKPVKTDAEKKAEAKAKKDAAAAKKKADAAAKKAEAEAQAKADAEAKAKEEEAAKAAEADAKEEDAK